MPANLPDLPDHQCFRAYLLTACQPRVRPATTKQTRQHLEPFWGCHPAPDGIRCETFANLAGSVGLDTMLLSASQINRETRGLRRGWAGIVLTNILGPGRGCHCRYCQTGSNYCRRNLSASISLAVRIGESELRAEFM